MQETQSSGEYGTVLHAGCVALAGRGVLILGDAGAGKSALALELMSRGARLVADDRVMVTRAKGRIVAQAPASLRGLIEARGVGLLRADAVGPVDLHIAVDLSQAETHRLPPLRRLTLLGHVLPLVFGLGAPHLGPAICQLVRGGRADPDAEIGRLCEHRDQ